MRGLSKLRKGARREVEHDRDATTDQRLRRVVLRNAREDRARRGLAHFNLQLQQLVRALDALRAHHKAKTKVDFAKLRTLRPGSQSYADQLNYLRLVSGLEMEAACDEVLGFQQPAPASAAPSATLPPELLHALAAWRFGRDDAMRQALENLPDPTRLSPGPRAVVSCLYAFSGREVEGFRLAEKISPLSLLESEAPFLQRSLR